MAELLGEDSTEALAGLVELGIQHEQQHQELLLMDIKHVLSRNPLLPAYDAVRFPGPTPSPATTWTEHPEGTYLIGHRGAGFCFDNELPEHREYLGPFALADQPVTCGQ
jgi:formylglycine-generating enzyme required for sulfatase activity